MGALGNTPRRQTVLSLEARKSYAFGLKFLTSGDKLPVDLTGATVRMVVAQPPHKGGATVIDKDATILDALLGLVQFELQASDLALAAGEYPFSITLVSSLGYSTLIMKGVVDVSANTETESTSATYAGINPSTNLAAYLESGDLVTVQVDHLDGMAVIVQGLIASFTTDIDGKIAAADADFDATAAFFTSDLQSRVDAFSTEIDTQLAQHNTDMSAQVGLANSYRQMSASSATAAASSATSSAASAEAAATSATLASEATLESHDAVLREAIETPGSQTDVALSSRYVASQQVRTITVSPTEPAQPAAGELWIPSTDYLTEHEHPENQPNLTLETRAAYYHHLWGSGLAGTDNLGAFAGALFNRVHLAPFYWPEDTAFQSFHAEVTTLGTGVLRFGIYPHDVNLGRPGPLLVDLGTVDVTTAGTKAITATYNLLRGWHWLCWVWQGTNTTGPVIRARTLESVLVTTASASFSPTTRHAALYASSITAPGALPANIAGTIVSNASPLVPSVALRRVA